MQRLRYNCLFSLALAMLLLNHACTSSSLEVEKPEPIDRQDMLRHYADDLIIPAFKELQTNVNALQASAELVATKPTLANLSALQAAWTKTHLSFQSANAYNFGPAGETSNQKRLVEEIGTFPISVKKMETNIAKGLPVPNDVNYNARGLLAVEYLIFDVNGNNQRILDGLITASREVYLKKQIANLKGHVDGVVSGWTSYRETFISSDGTAAGSSISNLYNEFVRSYEKLSDAKVTLAKGSVAGEPDSVEAFYSGKSLTFAQAHFAALENIWRGRVDGKDGLGFDDLLKTVTDGPALVASIENQNTKIQKAFTDLEGSPSLAGQTQASKTKVETLETELQKNTRFLKDNMSSLLGLPIVQ